MAAAKGVAVWRGQVRLPGPMFQWVKQRADESFRSVNAEFVEVIREAMQHEVKKNAVQ